MSLRKLGAWLDAAFAYRVTVAEAEQGFAVRYHRRDMDPVFVERFFPYAEVAALRLGDLRLRRRLAGRIGNRLQGMALEPGGYQDLFRTLGHDLDSRAATSIALEEEEEDMLVMVYTVEGMEQERRLSPRDRAVLRVTARSRRGHGKHWKLPTFGGR